MRQRQLGQLLILAGSIVLAGCASTVVPPVSGRVVDVTGAPIGGATVSIAPADASEARPRMVKTDRRGRFQRGEERRWFVALPVAAHAIGSKFTATASHGTRSAPAQFGGALLRQQFLGLTNRSE